LLRFGKACVAFCDFGVNKKKHLDANYFSGHSLLMIGPAQIRAARALLNWRQAHLAAAAKVSLRTVGRFENGDGVIAIVPDALRAALEAGGVEFGNDGGVKPRARAQEVAE
jgi:DNA-binding XRE family transcriptional regulator